MMLGIYYGKICEEEKVRGWIDEAFGDATSKNEKCVLKGKTQNDEGTRKLHSVRFCSLLLGILILFVFRHSFL